MNKKSKYFIQWMVLATISQKLLFSFLFVWEQFHVCLKHNIYIWVESLQRADRCSEAEKNIGHIRTPLITSINNHVNTTVSQPIIETISQHAFKKKKNEFKHFMYSHVLTNGLILYEALWYISMRLVVYSGILILAVYFECLLYYSLSRPRLSGCCLLSNRLM